MPIRGARELGLDREQIALFLGVIQVVNVIALMPVGALAAGCAILGLGLAGWVLPLSLLRTSTLPTRIATRVAGYRAGVDGGNFVGPFAAAALGPEGLRRRLRGGAPRRGVRRRATQGVTGRRHWRLPATSSTATSAGESPS